MTLPKALLDQREQGTQSLAGVGADGDIGRCFVSLCY